MIPALLLAAAAPIPLPEPAPAMPPAAQDSPSGAPQEPEAPGAAERRPNHLAGSSSPYLLQHVYNPVDWYPWGEEALERARKEQKPIFLSIGYAACHWCHVMERESFEDPEVAAFLNEHFVCIKVDREERPDLDDLYMSAVQAMTGHGGWPMSVWLTPERRPFWGGTYFPPRSVGGRPGFLDVCRHVARLWETERERVEEYASRLSEGLAARLPAGPAGPLPDGRWLPAAEERWLAAFRAAFDPVWGGFGQAPKFPRAEDLRWILEAAERQEDTEAREMALLTLRRMADGGMYDQIGGGFARYSVDAKWIVPHFEKMLYDQATLVPVYLEAGRQTGDPFFARTAREICDYLLRERRDPAGGFWSSSDADSEGEEGRYFVWTPEEIDTVLGPEKGAFARALFGVTEAGNFEGRNILTRRVPVEEALRAAGLDLGPEQAGALVEEVRERLRKARSRRVPPADDDKIVTGWNGLAVEALAMAGRILGEARYVEAARGTADFLLRELRVGGGWRRTWRNGVAGPPAVLEDLAYLSRGFLALFQSTGEERWLEEAEALARILLEDYRDLETGVFFDTDGRDTTVLHRRQSPWDGATPAANAVALESLFLLYEFTGDAAWEEAAEQGLATLLPLVERSPRAFASTLRVLAHALQPPPVAVVVGSGPGTLEPWRRALHAPGVPFTIPVLREKAAPDSALSLFTGRTSGEHPAALYLCQGGTCLPPEPDPARLQETLAAFGR